MTRAGKRYFKAHEREMAFEEAVLNGLWKVMSEKDPKVWPVHWQALDTELEQISGQLRGTVPLYGLMEMRIWVQSKLKGQDILSCFLELVAANKES